MRPISEIKANYRLRIVSSGEDGFAAYINHPCYKPTAIAVIASWGGGWEHVSVSLARRCPTWEEMCMVKDIFWGEEVRRPVPPAPQRVRQQAPVLPPPLEENRRGV